MRLIFKLVFSLVVLVVGTQLCIADGVIVRVTDSEKISSLVIDYSQILGADQAGNSPFVRFEVAEEDIDWTIGALTVDPRIIWVESEEPFGFRQNRSSHGSSVAAIFDPGSTFEENHNVWQQISYVSFSQNFSAIKVGIVDTGISHLQPAILSHVVAGASFIPEETSIDDFPTGIDTNLNGVFDEGSGHGTMMAGIILQMVPSTPLVIAKSADSDGNGTSWSVMKGIVFCVENQARIVNVSLGATRGLPGFSGFLDWVEDAGVTIVSPIGNNNSNMSLYPAAYSTVVNVTGLTPDNKKAPFSNWDLRALVAAPATGISSAWYDGGNAVWSGTSLSAPLVTGSLAAALALFPMKSPSQLRQALADSGQNIDFLNLPYFGSLGKLLDYRALIYSLGH